MDVFSGFSKFDRKQRLDFIAQATGLSAAEISSFHDYDAPEVHQQEVFSAMTENYIGNFPMPMGMVTNMLINDKVYIVPFVTEESSVIAAASKAAKFWAERGGFRASIEGITKKGQVHFTWNGKPRHIKDVFLKIKEQLINSTGILTEKMKLRGGGITGLTLIDMTASMPDYYQIDVSFETADAMGANFINSCLEKIASELRNLEELNSEELKIEVIMSILSNYTSDCKVHCWVECPAEKMEGWNKNLLHFDFIKKFKQAIDIANIDISRAVTHNKGIFNGIDAVLLATGNDWRATSASAHAFAARDGNYKSLTNLQLTDNKFRFELEIPLAIGTVGGITQIHPTVKRAMAILKDPDAKKLMMIVAAAGLANHFAAIATLITSGIQSGHMRMHLSNILSQLNASSYEQDYARHHFESRQVSYSTVENFIQNLRKNK
jgi:hydroxymethylglutaryl-CoA reductase